MFGLPLITVTKPSTSSGTNVTAIFHHNFSRQDQGVAEVILTFFTNFAKTGNPNEPHNIESVDYATIKEKTRFRNLTWEQYETGSNMTQQYLMIGLLHVSYHSNVHFCWTTFFVNIQMICVQLKNQK